MLIELVIAAGGYGVWRSLRRRSQATAEAGASEATPRSDPAPAEGALSRFLAVVEETGADALDEVIDGLRARFRRKSDPSEAADEAALTEQTPVRHDDEPSEAERARERGLLLSTGTLGAAVLGMTATPALLPVALVGLMRGMALRIDAALTQVQTERRFGLAGMDALAVTSVFLLGQFVAAAAFGTVLTGLHILIARTRDESRRDVVDLFGGLQDTAWRMGADGQTQEVALSQIDAGDRVVLRAGQIVPVDGVIIEGTVTLDQRALTGEEHPVEKGAGDAVLAGTLIAQGVMVVEVRSAGQDTIAAKVITTLLQTTDYRSALELRGLTVAERSVLPMLAASGLTLALLGPSSAAAVFFCSFGVQTRLTGPLTVLKHLRTAAQRGILVKDGRALEQLSGLDTIVFDKTGTLTEQTPTVVAVHVLGDESEDGLLRFAVAAEFRQAHPIAEAIRREAARRGIVPTEGEAPACEVGFGVGTQLDGRQVRVGSARFMASMGLPLPAEAEAIQAVAIEAGHSLVWLALDNAIEGAIELGATVRPEVPDVVRRLKARGLRVIIMSGDHEAATKALADQIGVDAWFAEVLPGDKADQVSALCDAGRHVCFVGDGINDAIALKRANVSISLRGATTLAVDTAQIVLTNDDLSAVLDLLDISDALDGRMKVNFAAATVPAALNLAGVYLLHTGVAISMAWALGGLGVGAASAITSGEVDSTESDEAEQAPHLS
ncbi:MAG: heavy metal translocating P-type ATPase [Myxococcales bacterium]|nr:heavy metal translocating P-type ATPase [Myxococcales bacterium]